jgi:uncharacterized protein
VFKNSVYLCLPVKTADRRNADRFLAYLPERLRFRFHRSISKPLRRHPIQEVIILCLAAWITGVSKAGFGGGLGMIVVPILAQIRPAKSVVGFVLPLLFSTDIFSLFHYWNRWDKHNVMRLVPGSLIGIAIGSYILNDISDFYLKKSIGVIACLFALLELFRPFIVRKITGQNADNPVQFKGWHGFVAGVLTGIFSTLAHVGGLTVTMYLLPQRLSNQAFVGTTTAIYFLINLTKIPFYIHLSLFSFEGLVENFVLLPYIGLGVILGIYLNTRFPKRLFSYVVLCFVFATGVKLLID